jgi:hypothetical protein
MCLCLRSIHMPNLTCLSYGRSLVILMKGKAKEYFSTVDILFYILQKLLQKKLCIFLRSITIHRFRVLNYASLISFQLQIYVRPPCCHYWLKKLKLWGCLQCHKVHNKFHEIQSADSNVDRGTHRQYRQHAEFISLFLLKKEMCDKKTLVACIFKGVLLAKEQHKNWSWISYK